MPTVSCGNCGKDTKNPKYCSRACSAVCTNQQYQKRQKVFIPCRECGVPIPKWPPKRLCPECKNDRKPSLRTIGYYKSIARTRRWPAPWIFNHIRTHARSLYPKELSNPCERCRYPHHVQVCHVQGVATFPDTATLGEINARENVFILCPNCHWELDHGLLWVGVTGLEPASSNYGLPVSKTGPIHPHGD